MTHLIQRIKQAYHLETDAEVADFLDIKPSTLSMQKNRGSLDLKRIISKCDDLNKNWLLEGKGPMRKDQLNNGQSITIYSSLTMDGDNQLDFDRSTQVGHIAVDLSNKNMELPASERLFGYLISEDSSESNPTSQDLGIFVHADGNISSGTVCLVASEKNISCREVAKQSEDGYLLKDSNGSTSWVDSDSITILGRMIWVIRSC